MSIVAIREEEFKMSRVFLTIVTVILIVGCGTIDYSGDTKTAIKNSSNNQIETKDNFTGVITTDQDSKIVSLSEQNITIDTNLLSCINETLFTPNTYMPSIQELQLITSLECKRSNIKDISILQNLTNLKELDLSYNQITDISALKNLDMLEILKLSDNFISDLSPLQNLYNLNELWIGYNKVIDFSYVNHVENIWGKDTQVFSRY